MGVLVSFNSKFLSGGQYALYPLIISYRFLYPFVRR